MTFDECPPPTKLSPLVDDDVGEEKPIRKNTKINTNNEEDESIEVEEIVNIKKSKNHQLDQVTRNRNQRNLRSKAQNHSNFFCFVSIIELKHITKALKDKSWVVAMQEELNQFIANDILELVPLPKSQSVIGTKWVFINKLDENGIISRNKARLVAQGYNQQEGINYDETYASVARLESIRILLAIVCANDFKLYQMDVKSAFLNGFINEDVYVTQPSGQNLCDDFAKTMHDEFKMSMMGELNFFLGLQIKQIEDVIFFNQSKYIKEMLKKFGLEDSKPTKTPMSTEIKLTKNDEAHSVDISIYQGTKIETHKSTSGVCMLMGCCLTSWFTKKQTNLAIFTTKAEYVFDEKACQQALWMKQALIDYGIRLENVPIMCDNKGAIDLSKILYNTLELNI
nr:copia protein [Tanacetum cinerariifolium]